MRQVKFVYFDLGNVVVNFDHSRISKNLSLLTGQPEGRIHQAIFESGLQQQYESGHISTEKYVQQFSQLTDSNPSNQEFCFAISDIFWLNRSIIPLITQLWNSGTPIAVLSNTCTAHWEFVLNRFPIIKTFFGDCKNILSYEIGAMKPEPKIYQFAVEMAGVDAHRILFMDDREENVVGARQFAMRSEIYRSPKQFAQIMYESGLAINL